MMFQDPGHLAAIAISVVDLPCLRFRMHVQKFQTLVFLDKAL